MSLRLLFSSSTALLLILPLGLASAQSLDEEQDAAEADERPPGSDRLGDEQADVEDEMPAEQAHDSTDPRELPNQEYFFLGGMYRHVFIPAFIQHLFVAGPGIEGSNPGAGLSFTYRKNDFGVVANLWWNGAQGEGFFRANGDPRTDTEHILADMGLVFITAEFMWSFPIVDWFAFELGFDLGFGVIYGSLTRTEAYESSSGADDWQPCARASQPGTLPGYCEDFGGHYGVQEPNWLSGGDLPVIFPWISFPHIALRFKPVRQVQIRIDGGYALYGFFVGGSVAYGF